MRTAPAAKLPELTTQPTWSRRSFFVACPLPRSGQATNKDGLPHLLLRGRCRTGLRIVRGIVRTDRITPLAWIVRARSHIRCSAAFHPRRVDQVAHELRAAGQLLVHQVASLLVVL